MTASRRLIFWGLACGVQPSDLSLRTSDSGLWTRLRSLPCSRRASTAAGPQQRPRGGGDGSLDGAGSFPCGWALRYHRPNGQRCAQETPCRRSADPGVDRRQRTPPRRGRGRKPATGRLRVHRGRQRAGGGAADRARPVRRGDYRPGDERRRRPGHSGQGQGVSARRRGDPGHGTWHCPLGRRCHAAGGLQLSAQALGPGPIAGGGRSGQRQPEAAAAERRAEPPAGRAVRLRGSDRHQRRRCTT